LSFVFFTFIIIGSTRTIITTEQVMVLVDYDTKFLSHFLVSG